MNAFAKFGEDNLKGCLEAEAFSRREINGDDDMIIETACWAHDRRKFFDLTGLQKAPMPLPIADDLIRSAGD